MSGDVAEDREKHSQWSGKVKAHSAHSTGTLSVSCLCKNTKVTSFTMVSSSPTTSDRFNIEVTDFLSLFKGGLKKRL